MRNDVNLSANRSQLRGADFLLRKSILQRQCPICNRFRCPLRSHAAFARQLLESHEQQYNGRLHQIDDQKADPFAKHPIEMTPELENLYALGWKNWNSDFRGPERHLFPFSRYTAIYRSGWNDEALYYAMLSVKATQISSLRTGTIDELALRLQLQAVTAQRKALACGEISDNRVLSALGIMSNALATNSTTDLAVHLNLIQAWVGKQGGLQSFGMEGIIADNLMYGDHVRAIMGNERPRYPVMMPAIPSSTAPPPTAVFKKLHLLGLISEDVAAAASNFNVMVRIFDRAAKQKASPSESTYFVYLANVVEWQLAEGNHKFHDTNSLDECIILAGLLGNHTLIRNIGQLVPGLSAIEARFWKCFEHLLAEDVFSTSDMLDLQCYLACMGTMTSVRRKSPNEKRAVKVLAQVRKRKAWRMDAFLELCDTMEIHGWSSSVCSTLYCRLWDESTGLVLIDKGLKVEKESEPSFGLDVPLRHK